MDEKHSYALDRLRILIDYDPDARLTPADPDRRRYDRRLVLRVIGDFQTYNGYAITIRELCDACHISSISVAANILRNLRDEGLLTWENGRARTLRVVEKPAISNAGALYSA